MDALYEKRMAALRERLRVALDPQTADEERVLEWLGRWDPPTLEPLAAMAERAVLNGTAGAFERGYHEGTQYAREHGSTS